MRVRPRRRDTIFPNPKKKRAERDKVRLRRCAYVTCRAATRRAGGDRTLSIRCGGPIPRACECEPRHRARPSAPTVGAGRATVPVVPLPRRPEEYSYLPAQSISTPDASTREARPSHRREREITAAVPCRVGWPVAHVCRSWHGCCWAER